MNASAPFLAGAGRFHTRLALCALVALALFIPAAMRPAAAHAASNPLDFSAGDQYVETLPTAKGPKVTENTPKKRAGSGLSKKVQKQLAAEGGSDGATLAYVAEAPELGAPASTGSDSSSSQDGGSKKGKTKGGAAKSSTSVPSAAISAAGGSGSGLGWLAIGLPLITAVALGAFGFQQRRNRDAG